MLARYGIPTPKFWMGIPDACLPSPVVVYARKVHLREFREARSILIISFVFNQILFMGLNDSKGSVGKRLSRLRPRRQSGFGGCG